MALTQSNVDVLEKALASGALSVDFPDGGRVTYRTTADLLAAIAYAKSTITPAATSQSVASYSSE